MVSKALAALLFLFLGAAPQVLANVKAGDPAPPIELALLLQAPENSVASWEALKGKVVVLEFWATWCGPCVEAIPHFNQLAEKFKDRPVQFLSITDEDEAVVKKFLQARNIAGWIGFDKGRSMWKAYGVEGIPHTVLVDRQGKVAAVTFPHSVTEEGLERMLAGKAPGFAPRPTFTEESKAGDLPPPLLEVVIRPSSTPGSSMRRSSDKLAAKGMTLRMALANAYDVPHTRIFGEMPQEETRYDVAVTVPKERREMLGPTLQRALAECFGLKVRRETREMEVFVLTAPEGAAKGLQRPASSGSSMRSSRGKMSAVNSSLGILTRNLEGHLERPVIDETKLDGRFDFALSWDADRRESIIRAVTEELGLELQPAKRPVEVLVVESGSGK